MTLRGRRLTSYCNAAPISFPTWWKPSKGYAGQEQKVFGDIANARAALLGADAGGKIAANGQLDGALGRLLVVLENYPQLRSNENFMRFG